MTDRPSLTALAVATGRAIGLRDLHDPLALRFLDGTQRQVAERLRGRVESGRAGELAVNALTAGLSSHAALRMSAVDRAVTAAIDDGAGQAVVVGAGFDTRSWRLEAFGGIRVVEVDLPAIQQVKTDRMADLEPPADVSFVPADLGKQDLDEVLTGTGHSPDVPTTWLWEAVAPYLPGDAVIRTIDAMTARSAPGSHLVMSYVQPNLVGDSLLARMVVPAARLLFGALGEPLLSAYEDDELAGLLAERGWTTLASTGPADWAVDAGVQTHRSAFGAERLSHARFG